MPSEMNPRCSSPSSFLSEPCFSDEREVGTWEIDHTSRYYGLKANGTLRTDGVASTDLGNRFPPDSQMEKGFDLPNYYLSCGRNLNLSSGKHFGGTEGTVSHSLPSAIDHHLCARVNLNTEAASYCLDGDKINLIGAQHENSLFSSSLSDLFSRKLNVPSNNDVYGHSVGAVAPLYEEEMFESLEELEDQTIGNLLPDDDDLLSGVTDWFHGSMRPNNEEDVEDLDLFSSVGGLELGKDGSSQRNFELSDVTFNNELGIFGLSEGELPFKQNPSRTLFVRNINSNIEDSEIRMLFEQYGDIRTLYTLCKHRGFVMVSYYDIRAACNAMKDLQNKSIRHRKLDIHFLIPKENTSEKDVNQGFLLVFNLDSSVSNDQLHEICGVYGEIKEIHETPHRSHPKLVEFYDVRAAEAALRSLNWSEIAGKQIKLEPGRPGGSKRLMQTLSSELEQEESCLQMQYRSSPSNLATGFSGSLSLGGNRCMGNGTVFGPRSSNGSSISPFLDNVLHAGVSSSVPNGISSLSRVESGNQSTLAESSHLRNQLNSDLQRAENFNPFSFPEFHNGLANGPCGSPRTMTANINARPPEMIFNQQFHRVSSNGQSSEFNEVFGSSGNGNGPLGSHYIWNNPSHPQSQATMWPNSPSFVSGITAAHSQQLHAVSRAPSHMLNALLPLNNHHVGSAPSGNPSLWDRRNSYAGVSPDATIFHPGSLGNMRISGNSPHPMKFVSHGVFPPTAGNVVDVKIPSRSIALHAHQQRLVVFPIRGQMIPMMSSFDSPNERSRSRRNEGSTSQSDNKKQFELDLDSILQGDDKRTTLMIKNIPNKYTSKMLLAAIDERHKGTYDFIYLPIDFKNKCNVGYAFINMTEPSQIVPFYQTINGKKWEKFNSEKVATLAYARIQGKAALIAHFQNSSLMNEDKRCRPILFHTDGPNAGDQVPFPMSSNIRPRSGKVGASTSEDLPSHSVNEDYSNGDSSSGSGKDCD